jgi:pimeloyl-ACP methyl ester carboxylesterase
MSQALRGVTAVTFIFLGCAIAAIAQAAAAQLPAGMSTHDVVVHGHHLTFHVLPGRLPALVLDAGGGTDSSYWNSIVPELAKRTGSEIVTYDRAGLGASDEVPPPYRIEDAVTHLESGLTQLGITHDLILVPHSYGGEIATYLAMRHPDWLSGAVLVDTDVPEFFTDEEVAHMGPIIQPMVAKEAADHPSKQTRTQKAITDDFDESSRAFHKAAWPESIPCIVIVSEKTPFPPSMTFDTALWIQAHKDFAAKAPNRTLIFAKGSSHDIAHERPELIVDAAGKLVEQVRGKSD